LYKQGSSFKPNINIQDVNNNVHCERKYKKTYMSFGLHCPIVVYEDLGHVLVMQDVLQSSQSK
jgi:hypothetical protein